MGRSRHTAVCLDYATAHPQLLVIAGCGSFIDVLNDAWMLDLQSERWRKVRRILHEKSWCMKYEIS